MKKIIWLFKRHPFLYYARFKLLSKTATVEQITKDCYNSINLKEDIPQLFFDINSKMMDEIGVITDIEKAKHISIWLDNHIKGGSGLSLSSERALQFMLNGQGGVCSDLAQVFNNFCVINNIQVREWGITERPFNRNFGGHSVNEIYSKEYDKWILIDVAKGVLFFKNSDDIPLSTLELFEANKTSQAFSYKSFFGGDKRKDKQIDKNYFNSLAVPFLISNYHNKTYDKFLNRLRPKIPVFIIHFILFILNKSYHYKFPVSQ